MEISFLLCFKFPHGGHLFCPSIELDPAAAEALEITIGLVLAYPHKIAVKCSLVPSYLLNSCLTLIIAQFFYCG